MSHFRAKGVSAKHRVGREVTWVRGEAPLLHVWSLPRSARLLPSTRLPTAPFPTRHPSLTSSNGVFDTVGRDGRFLVGKCSPGDVRFELARLQSI